eukprot:UN05463
MVLNVTEMLRSSIGFGRIDSSHCSGVVGQSFHAETTR